ncbi:MAG: hypothetical protein ACK2T5_16145 [Anaerolineales bacterium]
MDNRVVCRSEYQYEQTPTALVWDGKRLEIDAILAEWRSPQGKSFRVQAGDAGIFDLFYDAASSSWEISPL